MDLGHLQMLKVYHCINFWEAIALWKSDRNVSFAMATELREQGYDVDALAKAPIVKTAVGSC